MGKKPVIGIIEDHQGVREAMDGLIRSAGYRTAPFESAEAFLSSGCIDEISCLTLDIQLPGISGLELQRRLTEMKCSIPVIVITSSDGLREAALTQGAVAVFGKPFDNKAFLETLKVSVACHQHPSGNR